MYLYVGVWVYACFGLFMNVYLVCFRWAFAELLRWVAVFVWVLGLCFVGIVGFGFGFMFVVCTWCYVATLFVYYCLK